MIIIVFIIYYINELSCNVMSYVCYISVKQI